MPQEITIVPVLNGWVIRAGCQTLVYADAAKLIADFHDWVKEPERIEGYYKDMMARKGIPVPQTQPASDYASLNAPIPVAPTLGQAMQERAVQERRRG